MRVPFENVSKIYYRKIKKMNGIPSFEQFVDGIEKYNFGGTCYPNNNYFNLLLNHLGFDVKLCGADMSKPDVHLMNIVNLDGNEFIVDTGYAAPFLKPIPRNLNRNFEIAIGEIKYVIKPQDEFKRTTVVLYVKDELSHGYTVKPQSRKIEEFSVPIENSFNERSTFVHSLYLTRFYEDSMINIFNLKKTVYQGNDTNVYDIKNREELLELVHKYFNIPVHIVDSVIKEMSKLNELLNEIK